MWCTPQAEAENAFASVGKRRHEADVDTSVAEERIKRLRIGGAGNPWCEPLPFLHASVAGCSPADVLFVRSAPHSPMSQPMMPATLPHPGLARSWATAHAPMQSQGFGGFPPAAAQQPFGVPPSQHPFGGAPPPHGMMMGPPPPTTFSAAAAAAAICPSLNPHLQQHHHAFQQQQQHAYQQQHSPPMPPMPPAPPPVYGSLPAGPQLTPPRQPWAATRAHQHGVEFPAADAHYSGINALLGALHGERVHAGARQRWAEDPADEDDDEDL